MKRSPRGSARDGIEKTEGGNAHSGLIIIAFLPLLISPPGAIPFLALTPFTAESLGFPDYIRDAAAGQVGARGILGVCVCFITQEGGS